MVVGKGPCALWQQGEGAGVLCVEQGRLVGAAEQGGVRMWNVGQHGRGCRVHLLPHASVSGLHEGAQKH